MRDGRVGHACGSCVYTRNWLWLARRRARTSAWAQYGVGMPGRRKVAQSTTFLCFDLFANARRGRRHLFRDDFALSVRRKAPIGQSEAPLCASKQQHEEEQLGETTILRHRSPEDELTPDLEHILQPARNIGSEAGEMSQYVSQCTAKPQAAADHDVEETPQLGEVEDSQQACV